MNARASASALIEGSAERVYAILADYREGHPRILPPEYFRSLEVERGGVGEGTVVRIEMRVLGRSRVSRHLVSEPEPGRVLEERDVRGEFVTTFTVEPRSGRVHVTIETRWRAKGGPLGRLERWLTTLLLGRIYARELELLAERVRA
jgi:hypothetical protein